MIDGLASGAESRGADQFRIGIDEDLACGLQRRVPFELHRIAGIGFEVVTQVVVPLGSHQRGISNDYVATQELPAGEHENRAPAAEGYIA